MNEANITRQAANGTPKRVRRGNQRLYQRQPDRQPASSILCTVFQSEDVFMTEQSDSLTRRERRDYFAAGLSLGIALGLLWGMAVGNPSIGLVIGVAVGVALGAMMREAATPPHRSN